MTRFRTLFCFYTYTPKTFIRKLKQSSNFTPTFICNLKGLLKTLATKLKSYGISFEDIVIKTNHSFTRCYLIIHDTSISKDIIVLKFKLYSKMIEYDSIIYFDISNYSDIGSHADEILKKFLTTRKFFILKSYQYSLCRS